MVGSQSQRPWYKRHFDAKANTPTVEKVFILQIPLLTFEKKDDF